MTCVPRIWGILRELAAAELIVLADKVYQGAGEPLIIPYRGRNKPASQKDANKAHAPCKPAKPQDEKGSVDLSRGLGQHLSARDALRRRAERPGGTSQEAS